MTNPPDSISRRMLNVLVAVAAFWLQMSIGAAFAQTDAPRLTGQVMSSEEGAMEGVLVSAQQVGSPITVTVVSDRAGQFVFPSAKLRPGRYALRIRAVGYDLDSPQNVDLAAAQATTIDLKLRKTEDLASSTLKHGMADQYAGHGRSEAAADRMHELPHPRAGGALEVHG